MNRHFFQRLEAILAPDRLDAYRRDGVPPATTLARYLWNLALCESLYPPLQMAEIALRNSLHHFLSTRFNTPAWYDVIPGLPTWQQDQLADARQKLLAEGKNVTPGGMVAELHFGFWTGFFNKCHAQTGLGHAIAGSAFPHAPRPERNQRKLDARWKRIRDLRNRVFHHERIIHWADLDAQHAALLEVIRWACPELQQMAVVLDRYTAIRRQGLNPWLEKLRHHWPDPAAAPPALPIGLAVVPAVFDATHGAATPFGYRRGGDVFALADEHLQALQKGQALALDVQSEYVAFLKCPVPANPPPAEYPKPKESANAA
jgi:hypothetical protein